MATIVGWIFVVAAALTMGGSLWHHFRELRPRHWPSVPGQVVESIRHHDGHHASGIPRIRYRYQVGDLVYESERLSMSLRPTNGRSSHRILKLHPKGQQVRVYYDPADPSSAVIERPLTPEWAVLVTVAVVFLVLGGKLIFGYTRLT